MIEGRLQTETESESRQENAGLIRKPALAQRATAIAVCYRDTATQNIIGSMDIELVVPDCSLRRRSAAEALLPTAISDVGLPAGYRRP